MNLYTTIVNMNVSNGNKTTIYVYNVLVHTFSQNLTAELWCILCEKNEKNMQSFI